MSRVVHVAVGVIVNAAGDILIAKRPDKVHQGGLWEFPGGKVEVNETLVKALQRELHEELAINVIATEPLIKIRHDYGDKIVLLDVHKVVRFSGEPKGNEGQPVKWVEPKKLHKYEFPAANRPIITAINLPQRLLITGGFSEQDEFLFRVESALDKGVRLIQLRVSETEILLPLIPAVVDLCTKSSAQLQINTTPEIFYQLQFYNNIGLHLNSKNLMACNARPVSKNVLISASCHNQSEVEHAQKIGVDFILLSPVLRTKSHPTATPLGWQKFSALVETATIPVFALGGMQEKDLLTAVESGAQGIAAISQWWEC